MDSSKAELRQLRKEIVAQAQEMTLWYRRWEKAQNKIPPSDIKISNERLAELQKKRNKASDRFVAAKIALFAAVDKLNTLSEESAE